MDYDKDLKEMIQKYNDNNEHLGVLDIHVGENVIEETFPKVMNFGKAVLFCTGRNAMKRLGIYKKYLDLFKKNKIKVVDYDGIAPNPTSDRIEEGIRIAKKGKVDFIFCLGGGSVIDSGKAVSVGLFGDVWDYIEKKAEITKSLPLVANSTTSGTGSHITPYAVITNSAACEKKTLNHKFLVPKLSLADVNITKHLPPYMIATTGFDILCHGIEVYTMKNCDEAAAEFALKAVKLVGKHLYNSFTNNSIEDKLGMVYAEVFAGIALVLKITHVAHAISHPISARFPEINHGQALAYIMPKTIEMQVSSGDDEVKKRFQKLGATLGMDSNCAEALRKLIKQLKLDFPVREMSEADLQTTYEDTVRYKWSSIERSPSPIKRGDIKKIIFESFKDSSYP